MKKARTPSRRDSPGPNLFTGTLEAAMTGAVNRAWKNISAAAGIEHKPVNFENKKEPNA